MVGLRTVTVLEHEVIRVFDSDPVPDVLADVATWLTEVEAQALLSLNDLRRGFCQRVSGGIKLAQHCGIVRLSTCVVEVLPKVGMADSRTINELERSRGALLAMLHSARQVAITKVGTAPQQSVSAPLLDIFIEAFLHCALDQARRGLISRYVVHADDLSVIKGRFQAHGHVRRNLFDLTYCIASTTNSPPTMPTTALCVRRLMSVERASAQPVPSACGSRPMPGTPAFHR